MEKELITKFRNELEDEKAELEAKIDALDGPVDFGDDIDSLEEEADESTEWQNNESLAEVHRNRLANVEFALERIDKGAFGKCEECAGDIEQAVLEVDPASMLCRECKKHAPYPHMEEREAI